MSGQKGDLIKMPSNSLLHFITKVINLSRVKIINYYFITDNEILIEVKNIDPQVPCPYCGRPSDKVHQNHSHRVRDIPLSSYQVWLKVNRRQLKCTSCQKVFSEDLDFVKKRRSYTTRLAAQVLREVWETNVESAARRNGLTPAEIETLLKEAEAETCPEKPEDLKKLGIDEITQLKGGKNYAAILVNLETRKPIKRKKTKQKEKKLAGLTHSKYPLLKKKESLNDEEKAKVKEVKKVAPERGKMYDLKEAIRPIFASPIDRDKALDKFLEWTENAYKYFPESCRTISRWIDEILAYFDHRTTQGVVEGINQKIKLIKKRAYRLSNFDNFRRRILLNWYFSY
jgi:transposase